MLREIPYLHPGKILLEEFLKPMNITPVQLAKETGVAQSRINEIVQGKRSITTDVGIRISRFFGMNDGFWIRLQIDYDTAQVRDDL